MPKRPRGRTSITGTAFQSPSPTDPHLEISRRVEADRPIGPGTGKHRGDRRDTSRLYTGNAKHRARGNTPRADVKTRKR